MAAPKLCPPGPRGRAYMVQRYGTAGQGFVVALDATGAMTELFPLDSGLVMYGQVVVLDDETLSVLWASEKSGSDADIFHTLISISGYDAVATTLRVGSTAPDALAVGSSAVDKVYVGSDLVFG